MHWKGCLHTEPEGDKNHIFFRIATVKLGATSTAMHQLLLVVQWCHTH